MRREARALAGDPAALERAAREELGYVRPGERVYELPPRRSDRGEPAPPPPPRPARCGGGARPRRARTRSRVRRWHRTTPGTATTACSVPRCAGASPAPSGGRSPGRPRCWPRPAWPAAGFAGLARRARGVGVLLLLGAAASVSVGPRRPPLGRGARRPASASSWSSGPSSWSAPRRWPSSPSSGSGEGPLFPLVYLTAAVAVSFLSLPVGLALVALAAALQLGVWWNAGAAPSGLPGVLARVGFIVLFAVLYHAVLWARLAAAQRNEREAVERRLRELDERAREMPPARPRAGAIAAPSATRSGRWLRGRAAVVEVEAAMARRAGGGRGRAAQPHLRRSSCSRRTTPRSSLRECRSPQRPRGARRSRPREGVLGSVVARRAPLRLHGEIRAATYYEDGTRPRALLAVPLVDRRGGHVRGVLVADRLEDQPFDDDDEHLLATRGRWSCIRAVESERLMVELQRRAGREGALLRAPSSSSTARRRPSEVLDAAIDVAAAHRPARLRRGDARRAGGGHGACTAS